MYNIHTEIASFSYLRRVSTSWSPTVSGRPCLGRLSGLAHKNIFIYISPRPPPTFLQLCRSHLFHASCISLSFFCSAAGLSHCSGIVCRAVFLSLFHSSFRFAGWLRFAERWRSSIRLDGARRRGRIGCLRWAS
jgi:hypothetical protein